MVRHTRSAEGRPPAWLAAALVVGLVGGAGATVAATELTRAFAPVAADQQPAPDGEEQTPGGDPTAQGPTTDPTGESTVPAPAATAVPDVELTLVATGDVLTHMSVVASARTETGYDFGALLAPMDPWVQGADLALCHLEVPVAPEGTAPSGYPAFAAPRELADGLRANGWDGCSTASNHSLDRGFAGLVATLDALDAVGIGHAGTGRTAAEAAAPQVYELSRGDVVVRVAQLSATYGTNGIPLPADAPWSVQLLDVDLLLEQARAAREAGADLVVASVHCCVEYVSEPAPQQQEIAQRLADSGLVDLVIGHHAHVPQPVERLEGGPDGEGMWVAHGLGNYISNQDGECCSPRTDSGLIVTATIRKPDGAPARVTEVEWTALTVDRRGGHRVHPMPSTDLGAGAGTIGADDLAVRHGRVAEVVGDDAAERTTPPNPTGPPPVVLPRVPR